MKTNIILIIAAFLAGFLINNFFSFNISPKKAFAYSKSEAGLTWEYLHKSSDSMAMGYHYRAKVANGWLMCFDMKGGYHFVFIPDDKHTWQ